MAGQDVVQAKHLMVNDPLHEVERAPAYEQHSGKSLTGPTLRLMMCGPKKQNDAHDREHPDGQMKKNVLSVLKFQVFDRCGLTSGRRADQVMPAENLMEDNAVKEATQAGAEDDARTK